MWLLDTSTLELRDFVGSGIPPYAILSHTWGPEEVTFRDMRKDNAAAKGKAGYDKIKKCCDKAQQDGYRHVWIDTCCIDKRSSAELSEAINTMYRWYQDAKVCYAYLADVPSAGFDPYSDRDDDAFSNSRWFTRGWTLQELIAPRYIQFLAQDWSIIGTKQECVRYDATANDFVEESLQIRQRRDRFLSKLARITGISDVVLRNPSTIRNTAVAQRMAWAAKRETTREEDLAYALLGLFGVSLPILYGEGLRKAFRRLQLEIIQMIPDQSIFIWRADREQSGLLAQSPYDFIDSGLPFTWSTNTITLQPYSTTNLGLLLNIPIVRSENYYLLALRSWVEIDGVPKRVRLLVQKVRRIGTSGSQNQIYRRFRCDQFELVDKMADRGERKDIYVLEDEQYEHILWIDSSDKE